LHAGRLVLGKGAAFAGQIANEPQAEQFANVAGESSVVLGGTTFVDKGLYGAGRLDANTRDFRNETLGSFSGMAIDLSSWRRNADGSYAGGIYTLPDRGPFDGAIDYRNRAHTSDITFRPLTTGSAALPQVAASQSQVTITPTGGFVYPIATDGTAAGHISLDAEAIAFRSDGAFYVSDAAGVIDFNSTSPGATGRRNNQGLEAMPLEAKAWTAGAYAAVTLPAGLYAAWLGDAKFDELGWMVAVQWGGCVRRFAAATA
jgi:hypothetical protein